MNLFLVRFNFLKNIKRTDSRTIKWNLFFNYSSILYNVIIGILLVPLYLKYISADEYGAWLASGNIIIWMSLLDPGLSGTMQYKIAHALGNNESKKIGVLIGNSLIVGIIFFITLCICAVFVQYYITTWLDISKFDNLRFLNALAFTSLSTSLMMFSFTIAGINMGLQSSLGIGIIFTLMNILGIISTVYFLMNGYGLLAFGYSGMIRAVVYLSGNLLYLYCRVIVEKYKVVIDRSGLKELVSLLGYNFIGKTAGTLQSRVFDFLIAKFVSFNAVTSFRISLSAPDNCKLILVRPTVSISPILSKSHGSGDLEEIKYRLKQMVFFFLWVSAFIFSAFFLFNEVFVQLWVGKEFYSGPIVNVLICIMVLLASFSDILSQFVWAMGEMKKNNIATTIQFIFFLPLGILLSYNYGVIGLLVASIFSYSSVTIWYFAYLISIKLGLSYKSSFIFIKELFLLFIIIVITIISFWKIEIYTWLGFVSVCAAYSIIFFILISILSKQFRNTLQLVASTVVKKKINIL